MPQHATRPDLDELISRMRLEEKLGQMTLASTGLVVTGSGKSEGFRAEIGAGRIGFLSNVHDAALACETQSIALNESRLGIPLVFASDVIHGFRTMFPVPLAEMATFDPALWQATAVAAAEEASASGVSLTFAPMLDVTRDPRWGRIAESPGEDAWIASRYAQAKVEGFQGDDLSAHGRLAATAKHLAAYGAVTGGREYASVDISEHTLHDVYLPPFHAAVSAGVSAIMPAFTDLAGIPMSANVAVLQDLVRKRWGFSGVMVSDHGAIAELKVHGVAANDAEAAALALRAGIDVDLMSGTFANGLPEALRTGIVTPEQVDSAVRRILELKVQLGLFDDPYRGLDPATACSMSPVSNRALARKAATRAIVLLQDRDRLLPLGSGIRQLAVIGPLADTREDMLGPWEAAGRADEAVSLLEGLRSGLSPRSVQFAQGTSVNGPDTDRIASAVAVARQADLVVLCLGESRRMSGEAASRALPGLPGKQADLARAVLDTGTPVVVVLTSGRPLIEPWLFERASTVLATWFLGSEAGHALADVLAGRWNPSGRLPVSWPVAVGQIPVHFGQRPTGRPADPGDVWTSKYLDISVEPRFHFGHGLSYSRVKVSNLCLSPTRIRRTGPAGFFSVSVEIANEGSRAGEQTLFVFTHVVKARIAQPQMRLAGVSKAYLEPGEQQTLRWELDRDVLAYLDSDLRMRRDPGDFDVLVGIDANRAHLLSMRLEVTN